MIDQSKNQKNARNILQEDFFYFLYIKERKFLTDTSYEYKVSKTSIEKNQNMHRLHNSKN